MFRNEINDRAKVKECPDVGVYTREKQLCKNLGVKEGGGHLLKGGVFSGAYMHIYVYRGSLVCGDSYNGNGFKLFCLKKLLLLHLMITYGLDSDSIISAETSSNFA